MFALLAILSALILGICIERMAKPRPVRLVARVEKRPRR